MQMILKRILITGGTGFVGRHVVERFLAGGHSVRLLVRSTSDTRPFERKGLEIIRGDLADTESCRRVVQGIDVVVNLATTMSGTGEETEVATIRGSAVLFEEAHSAGVTRLVHISSLGVLPMGKDFRGSPIAEEPIYELEECYLTNYVRGKIGSEKAALDILQSGKMEVSVLRPGIVFGPGGSPKLSRLGTTIGNTHFLLGGGKQPLPVTYVENLADAVYLAAVKVDAANGIFHIIEDDQFSAQELLAGFREKVDQSSRVIRLPKIVCNVASWGLGHVAKRLKRINPLHKGHLDGCSISYRYENKRARETLGWKSTVGKEEALVRSYAFWKTKYQPVRRADITVLGKTRASGPVSRIALIGCGGIAAQHLQFLRKTPDIEVVACCDPTDNRAEVFAIANSIPCFYTDLEKMLREQRLTAVHVLTPPQYTMNTAVLCLRAGCHVLVEKPMAINSEEVKAMQAEAEKAGRILCVDHNHSYDAIMVEARRIITTGQLGEIIWLDSFYGFDLRSNPGNPLLGRSGASNWNFQLPGGLFQNLVPHPLSVVVEFLSGPLEVKAIARGYRLLPHQSSDELRVMITTPTAGALVTVSLAASPKFQTLRVHGTHGTLELDFTYKLLRWYRNKPGIPSSIYKLLSNVLWGFKIIIRNLEIVYKYMMKKWIHYDGMERLIAEFHFAARNGSNGPIPNEESLRVTQVMDEAWRQIGKLRIE